MHDMIKRDIIDSYTDVVDSLLNKCDISERIGNAPIRVSDSHVLENISKVFNTIN